ncbi:hypothetical protein CEW46_21200 [Bacillus cereus]|nr:hypothetical protein CEW46_21200 [Bacillus cereus]
MSTFVIELDTKKPVLSLQVPTYAVQGVDTQILVSSSEPLDVSYQEVSVVDSKGHKINLVGEYIENDELRITTTFTTLQVGLIKITCRLRDEVHNKSDEYVASLNLIAPESLLGVKQTLSIRELLKVELDLTKLD